MKGLKDDISENDTPSMNGHVEEGPQDIALDTM